MTNIFPYFPPFIWKEKSTMSFQSKHTHYTTMETNNRKSPSSNNNMLLTIITVICGLYAFTSHKTTTTQNMRKNIKQNHVFAFRVVSSLCSLYSQILFGLIATFASFCCNDQKTIRRKG